MPVSISSINLLLNFNLDVLCLIGSGAGSGACLSSGSGTCLGAYLCLVFSNGNMLLLKLLRIFSLALRTNIMLFRKDFFSTGLYIFCKDS